MTSPLEEVMMRVVALWGDQLQEKRLSMQGFVCANGASLWAHGWGCLNLWVNEEMCI